MSHPGHDPLCNFDVTPVFGKAGWVTATAPCTCERLARVRADERERIYAIDFTHLFRTHIQHGYVCSCGVELNEMATHMANVIHRAIQEAT